MTTFGLYGTRLSLAVWRHFTCYFCFVFTYFVLSLKNKYTLLLYYTIIIVSFTPSTMTPVHVLDILLCCYIYIVSLYSTVQLYLIEPVYHCIHLVDVHVCTDDRCLNGATCEELPGGNYTCHCLPHFFGKTCEGIVCFMSSLFARRRATVN